MNFNRVGDNALLHQIKQLAGNERELLTKILHHLKEIDRRKLFSDLGYPSLFAYAVGELKYSESQAGRRLAAMRLLKEIPEIEEKIESGVLNLSQISKAQWFFRNLSIENAKAVPVNDKKSVLKQLEGKSSRDVEAILEKASEKTLPGFALPPREIRVSLTDETQRNLEEIRSLLGPRGAAMNLSQLLAELSVVGLRALREKKFGKKGANILEAETTSREAKWHKARGHDSVPPTTNSPPIKSVALPEKSKPSASATPRPSPIAQGHSPTSTSIPRGVKFAVWKRDKGRCRNCGSTRNLNFDHIKPTALGGSSTESNLRLLCFSCNRRQAIRTFGLWKIQLETEGQRK